MTFDSAIRTLSDGKAAKLASWGGYVYRTDITTGIPEFSSSSSTTYSQGDLVRYLYNTYVCKAASCTGGTWDPDNWEKTAKYSLTFRKRSGSTATDKTYIYTPGYVNGSVVYTVEPDGDSSSEWDEMMPLDGALLLAFQSQDWIIGTTTEFESARTGTTNIW